VCALNQKGAVGQMLNLKHPSELSQEELNLTVHAVWELAGDELGVTCIIRHQHGLSLIQAVALAIAKYAKEDRTAAEEDRRSARCQGDEHEALRRGCEIALDALGRVSVVDEGRDWIAAQHPSCPSLIESLCAL
jgi:hypothetical protein